jgi:hypothetical protein
MKMKGYEDVMFESISDYLMYDEKAAKAILTKNAKLLKFFFFFF